MGQRVLGKGSPTVEKVNAVVQRVALDYGVKSPIGADDSLVDRGMTSMALVDLMLAVEADFDITIPQRDLTPANLRSIQSLGLLLERLQS